MIDICSKFVLIKPIKNPNNAKVKETKINKKIINIGYWTLTSTKNIDVINIICNILNDLIPRNNGKKYEELITYVDDRLGHDLRYAISNNKISSLLNWNPKISFNDGIRKTILWYLNNKEWWKNN